MSILVTTDNVRQALKAMKLMEMLDNQSKGIAVSGTNKKDAGDHKVSSTSTLPPRSSLAR